MTKLAALFVVGLVGCGGGGNNQQQKVPCQFTVAGGPGGQFSCFVGLQYSAASNIAELTIGVQSAAPFDGISISAGSMGMPAAGSTWVQTDAGASGVIELTQGQSIWAGGATSPPVGSYSFAFSSVTVDVSAGSNTVYNPHGMWSAVAPAQNPPSGPTLNLTGSF
jgi:hypothetical protein